MSILLPPPPHHLSDSGSALISAQPQDSHGLPSKPPAAAATQPYPPATANYDQVAQSSQLFWEKLEAFHRSFGTKFTVPTVGGKALDLHCLFVEVTSRGGLEKVIRDRKWKEVVMVFKYPITIIGSSFVLRKYYQSFLFHFEQAYYFRKQFPPSMPGSVNGSLVHEGATVNQLQGQECPIVQPGGWVTGTINGKFDNGYLFTVNLGSTQLHGVLYHVPEHGAHKIRARRPRLYQKRLKLALRDPSKPKSNRSGHYGRLKPYYHRQERAINKKIGVLWNNITEAEKQAYHEKGVRDEEGHKNEMLEYKSSNASQGQS